MIRSAFKEAVATWTVICLMLVLIAMVLALGGCAGGFSAAPTTGSQQMVYSAETDFSAALRVAVAYEALPPCPAAGTVCADPATVTKITAAAKAARASLTTAEAAVRSSTNADALATAALQAQSDVAAFKSLADTLGAK